jgi:hypothetical protein
MISVTNIVIAIHIFCLFAGFGISRSEGEKSIFLNFSKTDGISL